MATTSNVERSEPILEPGKDVVVFYRIRPSIMHIKLSLSTSQPYVSMRKITQMTRVFQMGKIFE